MLKRIFLIYRQVEILNHIYRVVKKNGSLNYQFNTPIIVCVFISIK